MESSGNPHRRYFTSATFLPLLAALTLLSPPQARSQDLVPTATNQAQPIDATDSNQMRPLNQDSSLLSLPGGQRLIAEANSAVSDRDYALAAKKLQEARQVFNQLSNFYQELGASFAGIDNRLADMQRRKAVETAQMRDEATYQLAVVHQAQNQPELAVPLLVQIIRSQNPTRDLGQKAYKLLSELGFVDSTANNSGLLSLPGGQQLMTEANTAVSSQDYALAAKKLQEARQVFNQLSNFYQELAASFSGIDNSIADVQRTKAVETAQMRDEATYRLALVHRSQNQPELAVPLLVQIIRSQNPTRDLGKQAYQQLFELGFVDSPYPRAGTARSPRSSAQ